jgi:Cysteine rich repeat
MTSHITAASALVAFLLLSTAAYGQTLAEKVQQACAGDVARLCANVPPGEGQVVQCLKAQKRQVTFGCKRALFQAKQAKEAQDAAAAQSTPPPAVPH